MKLNKATEQEFRIIQIKQSHQQKNYDFSPTHSDVLSAASSKIELSNLT